MDFPPHSKAEPATLYIMDTNLARKSTILGSALKRQTNQTPENGGHTHARISCMV
jgi:hypothetical protein